METLAEAKNLGLLVFFFYLAVFNVICIRGSTTPFIPYMCMFESHVLKCSIGILV